MRNLLATIVALLPLMAAAQSFTLTPQGFVNADDNEKTYVVVEMPGTQAELYAKAKTAVTSMWNSPKDAMSYDEPNIIVVNGYSQNAAHFKKWGRDNVFGMEYRLQIQFKDGRIRIDAPAIGRLDYANGQGTMLIEAGDNSTSQHITRAFEKNGKVRFPDFNKNVEDYFNGLVATLIDKMKNGVSNDEDW